MLQNLECPVGLSQKKEICVHLNEGNWARLPPKRLKKKERRKRKRSYVMFWILQAESSLDRT